MPLRDALIAELKYESSNTRKILERVPEDQFGWKPHEKNMTLGRLASHIAEIPQWVNRILTANELDFATANFSRITYETRRALLEVFDQKLSDAILILETANEEMLNAIYVMRRGEHTLSSMPRKVVLRNFAYNHLIHHRGQLSVYLRLLNIPIPGMYGPSADEINPK